MLERVFAPFLECCGDAVMFAKRNAAVDDEDDVTTMTVVFLLISGGGCEEVFVCDDFQMRCCIFLICSAAWNLMFIVI